MRGGLNVISMVATALVAYSLAETFKAKVAHRLRWRARPAGGSRTQGEIRSGR